MNDEPITLSEIAAGGVSALNRLRLLIDRTQRAATPMNDAWVSLTAEIERALVDQSLDQDTLMRDVQTALSLLAKRTEECEALRAQLSEAQARLAEIEALEAELKELREQLDGARKCVSDDAFTRYNEPFAYYHERISDGMGLWLKGDDRRVAGYRLVCKLYASAATAAPVAQQPHRLKEASVVQSNNSAGLLSAQAAAKKENAK